MIQQEKINNIPNAPGVYIFKDKNSDILYIGKAFNLNNRVKSYFTKTEDIRLKTLGKKINDIECFVTNNEVEALLLENNLIKKHQPRYNINLKDSKSYPMLKITDEFLPRIIKCREKINDYEEYYGPFISIQIIKSLLKIFSKVLKLRPCNKKFKPPYKYNPCLNYHIGKCNAPCASYITEKEYLKAINTAREILKGNTKHIIEILNRKMIGYSEKLNYEQAAKIRDQIKILADYNLLQYMDTSSKDNSDYIGIYSDFKSYCVSIIQQRNGKVIGKESFIIDNAFNYQDFLIDFLNFYYLNITSIPPEVFLQEEIENGCVLESAIMEKLNLSVKFKKAENLKDKKLIILAKQNAEIYFEEKQYKLEKLNSLRELKKSLNLPKLPRIIEGIDIATLDGKYNVGALVYFADGKPIKSNYRQYNIESKGHPDDYAMIEEVVARRYQRQKNEKKSLPDLILIDGGKGQLHSAYNILKILNLNIPLIGLAKKEEQIYLLNKKNPIILPKSSLSLKLLQKIRDEAHRFSNTRLSKRHRKGDIKSKLLEINGIGTKRLNTLIKKFGSINALKNVPIEEIVNVPGLNRYLAEKIKNFLAR
ncbi:MAG: excinuclease ABC subunit UvrC [Spirochaetes bacterium]|nr:excinuclease ABC subunit UvrC [Spirochaetota bacterium]